MSFFRCAFSRRTLATVAAAGAATTVGGYWFLNSGPALPVLTKQSRRPPPPWNPPSREEMLAALRKSGVKTLGGAGDGESYEDEFDLLIVGGGATGAGTALDAASRGLKVALVERDDFSAGTSSKSTKLVHGGVRYLQKAFMELDYEQYKLVREALHERRIFLHTAPYLSHMLPIMLPIYKYWQVPYYWAGCKMYDLLAGKENMESSYLMSKGKALEAFPMLKSDGLVGALVYYDGQHNDSRMNVALIMTAVQQGAIVANHVNMDKLLKDARGKINGATVTDTLTGRSWDVRAKGVINATGPFTDALLQMDDPSQPPVVQASSGIHVTLPNYYSPRKMGLLDPATSDGRVIFFLPWQGHTIAGTTDTRADVETNPVAQEEDIRWVLEEVRRYLSADIRVRRGDVLSAWSGLRPLVRNPKAASTEGLVRNHMIHVSESGLVTIAGGKWTTYRAMSEETVDVAIKEFGLKPKNGCVTESLRLVGSDGWSKNMFIGLVQRYGIDTDVAKHLGENYGDRAWVICSLAQPTGISWPLHGIRLSPSHPVIEAEVRYAVRYEMAQTAIDFIARRSRLSFLNAEAALEALPRVIEIMSEEIGWSRARKRTELERGTEFLRSMGLSALLSTSKPASESSWVDWAWESIGLSGRVAARKGTYSRAQFEAGEVDTLKAAFSGAGTEDRLKSNEVQSLLSVLPEYGNVRQKDFDYVLDEAGFAGKDTVSFDEFLEICAGLKDISALPTRQPSTKTERRRIPVEKSGGGV